HPVARLLAGREPAVLAALADGSLAPGARAALEARVVSSAELGELLSEQQRAVTIAYAGAAQIEASAALRARIEAQRPRRRRPSSRRVALVGAATTLVAAVLLGLSVSGPGRSSERFHAALTATILAPEATGEAELTRTASGWRIELDAPGLPRRDG